MWGAEWQLHTEPMQTGTAALEHRKGSTSHQNNPGSPPEESDSGIVPMNHSNKVEQSMAESEEGSR